MIVCTILIVKVLWFNQFVVAMRIGRYSVYSCYMEKRIADGYEVVDVPIC